MCRDEFNKAVRPYVREFPIGKQGVGFDRLELDQWADQYIAAHSNPKLAQIEPGANNNCLSSPSIIRKSQPAEVDPHARSKREFERVLEIVRGGKKARAKR
jgi:hypothetical protein